MKKICFLLLFLFIALVVVGCFKGEAEVMRQVELRVQEIRHLDFVSGVTYERRPTEVELFNELREGRQARAFKLFGLISSEKNYLKLKKTILSQSTQFFYDWKGKKIVVSESTSSANFYRELPWLFTQALQDQNFSLGDVFQNLKSSGQSDRLLALKSLSQGDALLVQHWNTFVESRDSARIEEERLSHNSEVRELPEVLSGPYFFMPQVIALKAVQYVVKQGGWRSLDRVYRHPRISTEWLLHPEKMVDLKDMAIEIPPQALPFPLRGWKVQHTDVLGEYYLRIFFKKYLSERDAMIAADGWRGDRYQLYQDLLGRSLLIWKVQMDTDLDLLELRISLEKISNKIMKEFAEGTYTRQLKRTSRGLMLIAGDPKAVADYLEALN